MFSLISRQRALQRSYHRVTCVNNVQQIRYVSLKPDRWNPKEEEIEEGKESRLLNTVLPFGMMIFFFGFWWRPSGSGGWWAWLMGSQGAE